KSIGETWVPEPEPASEEAIAQIPALIKKLAGTDSAARIQAAKALREIGLDASPAFATLFRTLKDNDPAVRGAATEALARIPPDKGDVSMLCRVCGDAKETMGIRVQGVQALGRLGPEGKSGLPTLVGLLKQPDGSLRRLALEALAAIGPDAKAAAPEL